MALKDRLRFLSGSWLAIEPTLSHKEMQELGICMTTCNLRPVYLIAMYDFLLKFKERGFDFVNEFGKKYESHPWAVPTFNFGAFDLSGLPKVAEWEKKYIPSEN